jgi:hypothetical protein
MTFANIAKAEDCPTFFRFADFGLKASDGTFYRGGPVFRAEGFDGAALLLGDGAVCLRVPIVAKDGRGNNIPVVSSISYDPAKTGIALTSLRVASVDDTMSVADARASAHLAALGVSATKAVQGADFLCAYRDDSLDISCQFRSPFAGNAALVVYCGEMTCNMPVLAINDRIFAAASWNRDDVGDIAALASLMLLRIEDVRDFLGPLSSGL